MSANFTEFFGFMEDPFKRTPDIEFYFQSKQHQEALYTLNYLLSSDEGFIVLTGHPGTGKSITIRRYIHDLPSTVLFAYILFPNLKPEEMFQAVLEDFGIAMDDAVSKNALFSRLKDFLVETKKAGKQALIIIDEAQNLPVETLEELRILSNLETDKEKLLKIALVGQPELDIMLNTNELRQLKQRVTLSSHLVNLTQEETRDYITYRLQKAGRNNINISPAVVKNVWSYTHGNPRLINIVMQRAIIAAYMDSAHRIKKSHFDSAIKSLNMLFKKHAAEKQRRKTGLLATLAVAVLAVAAFGYYSLFTKHADAKRGLTDNTSLSTPVSSLPTSVDNMTVAMVDNRTDNTTQDPVNTVVDTPPSDNIDNRTTARPTDNTPIVTNTPNRADNTTATLPNNTTDVTFGENTVVIVDTSALNVRSEPLIDARRVGTLWEGESVTVKEETDFWVRVQLDDGTDGWVYKRYLRLP